MSAMRAILGAARQSAAIGWALVAVAVLNGCGGDSVQKVPQYSIGGTVSGLVGTGLVLQDNGVDNLTPSGSGVFTFATPLANGDSYAVTVATQPTNPAQECIVTTGTGTVSGDKVTNVQVSCSTEGFTVGGTINGLTGSGLVLQDNGGSNLPISSAGAFTFINTVGSGSPYSVTIKTQPSSPTQTCTVSNGSGTIGSANVQTVVINCVNTTFTVGGTVSGLAGSGLVLQDNGGDNLAISASGAFTFATPVALGAPYAVTVKTQPANLSQTCTVTNGAGTMTAAAVTNVSVACVTNSYSITANVIDSSASPAGTVLQNNGGGNLNVTGTGSFTFATQVASGQAYDVTVLTQPSVTPAQYCQALNGSGIVTLSNVTVTVQCVNVGRFVFVAAPYDGASGDVSAFTINPVTGNLTAVGGSPYTADAQPTAIALDPTGQFAYVANLQSADVSEFTVGVTGALTFVANYNTSYTSDAGSPNYATTLSVAVDPVGGYAFAGSAVGGSPGLIDSYSITAGALTEVAPATTGHNPLALAVDPSGSFVFATNKYDNNISVFKIGIGGALTSVSSVPYATGNNPVGVAVSPNAGFIYVANSGGGTVSAFAYDPTSGALSELTSLGSPYSVGTGANSGPTGIAVDPTGRFLYVTDYTDGSIAAFGIASTGQLSPIGSPVATGVGTGSGPNDIKVEPSGHFAYVANFLSNTVSVLAISPTNGALTLSATVPAANASAALAVE
jgi:6-phosphogluconolactonase (cycloisomerase 2 family)